MAQSNYLLGDSETESLTRNLVLNHPTGDFSKPYCVYTIPGSDVYSDLGRVVEANVFNEKFGDDPASRQLECAPYEKRSVFFLVVETQDVHNPRPVGVIRLILPHKTFRSLRSMRNIYRDWGSVTQKKAIYLIERFGASCQHTADVASMAVIPELQGGYQGSRVTFGLLATLYQYVQDHNIWWLVGIMADEVLDGMTQIGFGLIRVGDSRNYMGWPSTPFLLNVGEVPQAPSIMLISSEMPNVGDPKRIRKMQDIAHRNVSIPA